MMESEGMREIDGRPRVHALFCRKNVSFGACKRPLGLGGCRIAASPCK